MGAPTSGLQYVFEIQMQQNNEKRVWFQNPKMSYFVWNVLKKKWKPF
jgi:hypothetical protein